MAQSSPPAIKRHESVATLFSEGAGGKIYAENYRGKRISGAYGDVGANESAVIFAANTYLNGLGGGIIKIAARSIAPQTYIALSAKVGMVGLGRDITVFDMSGIAEASPTGRSIQAGTGSYLSDFSISCPSSGFERSIWMASDSFAERIGVAGGFGTVAGFRVGGAINNIVLRDIKIANAYPGAGYYTDAIYIGNGATNVRVDGFDIDTVCRGIEVQNGVKGAWISNGILKNIGPAASPIPALDVHNHTDTETPCEDVHFKNIELYACEAGIGCATGKSVNISWDTIREDACGWNTVPTSTHATKIFVNNPVISPGTISAMFNIDGSLEHSEILNCVNTYAIRLGGTGKLFDVIITPAASSPATYGLDVAGTGGRVKNFSAIGTWGIRSTRLQGIDTVFEDCAFSNSALYEATTNNRFRRCTFTSLVNPTYGTGNKFEDCTYKAKNAGSSVGTGAEQTIASGLYWDLSDAYIFIPATGERRGVPVSSKNILATVDAGVTFYWFARSAYAI
ncbi:hypothetical protein M0R72_06945 [Candidatus Pacearchaeota archaeon]|jgi:hypothetical protein|nr:hypothetical protein [Candidatus Pacearchaeota archaeon]